MVGGVSDDQMSEDAGQKTDRRLASPWHLDDTVFFYLAQSSVLCPEKMVGDAGFEPATPAV